MSDFTQAFVRKGDELGELDLFATVCAKALRQSTKAVEMIDWRHKVAELLNEPSPYSTDGALERARSRATEIAKFAETQVSAGLPYLFGLCSVRAWALIEALVDEIIVESLRDPTKCKDQDFLGKLKGPLIAFKCASPDEQAEFLAETLKQAVDAPLKAGIGRFEAVLTPVGLGGSVLEPVRKTFFELSQVRNAVVHKGGVADRRLTDACPWLGIERGKPVEVTAEMFRRYLAASYWYTLELKGRTIEQEGQARPSQVREAQDAIATSGFTPLGEISVGVNMTSEPS